MKWRMIVVSSDLLIISQIIILSICHHSMLGMNLSKSLSTDLRTCECWLNLRRWICQNLSWYTLTLFPLDQWSCIYLHQSTIWACILGTEFDFQGSGIHLVSLLVLTLYWRNLSSPLFSIQAPLSVFLFLPFFLIPTASFFVCKFGFSSL